MSSEQTFWDMTWKIYQQKRDEELGQNLDPYAGRPLAFIIEVLRAEPTGYQREIIEKLFARRRMAVRSPHGAGKTSLAAWVVLYGLATFMGDYKIVTTASAWRQLSHFLWPEIAKWYRHADWSKAGCRPELLKLSARTANGEAFAVASNQPDLIEGAHASTLLYVLDEAKAIPDATWDAVEGAFATGQCYALAISTPGAQAGRFWQLHHRDKGYEDWSIRHVTLTEGIQAGRISAAWAQDRKRQWGEQSPIYQARVLGEFPVQESDRAIALRWVELARAVSQEPAGPVKMGIDWAAGGANETVATWGCGPVIQQRGWHDDPEEDIDNLYALIRKEMPTVIRYDGNGPGAIQGPRLRDLLMAKPELRHIQLRPILANATPDKLEQYQLKRDELWLEMAEALRLGKVDLSHLDDADYDLLEAQLVCRQATLHPQTDKLMVETKKAMAARGLESPDRADSLALYLLPEAAQAKKSYTYADYIARRMHRRGI